MNNMICTMSIVLVLSGLCLHNNALAPNKGNKQNQISLSELKEGGNGFFLNTEHITAHKHDSSLAFFDSVYKQAVSNEDIDLAAKSAKKLSDHFYFKGFYKKAISYNDEAIKMYRIAADSLNVARNYVDLANIKTMEGEYDISLTYLLKALKIFREKNDSYSEAKTLNNIAIIYDFLGDTSHALSYYGNAADIFEEAGMTEDLTASKNNIILIYAKMKMLDKAIFLTNELLNGLDSIAFQSQYASICVNLGSFYLKKGLLDKSYLCFKKALSLFNKFDNYQGMAFCLHQMGILSVKRYEFKLALTYFSQSFNICNQKGFAPLSLKNSLAMADLFHSMSNDSLSYYYLDKAYFIRDSLFKNEKAKHINMLKTKFEYGEMENELELREAELIVVQQKQDIFNLQRYVLVILLALVVCIFVIIYIFFRSRIKISNLKKIEIEKRLKYKVNEITFYADHIQKTQKLFEAIKSKLHVLKANLKNMEQADETLKQLMGMLSVSQFSDDDQILLYHKIEETSKYFFMKLNENYPELSKNEQYVCALLRLGFSSKQIASLRNLQPASIDICRYRIRKKLSITKGQNLNDFLSQL